MAEEPPRERLFDVLMRRLEALAPLQGGGALAAALGAAQSAARAGAQRHGGALAAMDAGRRRHRRVRPQGAVRAQGLALLFAHVLRTWVDDDEPGLARTLAALDRELARGQRWAGLLDDLCRIPDRASCAAPRRRRRRAPRRATKSAEAA